METRFQNVKRTPVPGYRLLFCPSTKLKLKGYHYLTPLIKIIVLNFMRSCTLWFSCVQCDFAHVWSCTVICIVVYGRAYLRMVIMDGHTWSLYGHVWSCMVINGHVWSCMVMVMYRHVWLGMAIYDLASSYKKFDIENQ